jgi:hypothetical protein
VSPQEWCNGRREQQHLESALEKLRGEREVLMAELSARAGQIDNLTAEVSGLQLAIDEHHQVSGTPGFSSRASGPMVPSYRPLAKGVGGMWRQAATHSHTLDIVQVIPGGGSQDRGRAPRERKSCAGVERGMSACGRGSGLACHVLLGSFLSLPLFPDDSDGACGRRTVAGSDTGTQRLASNSEQNCVRPGWLENAGAVRACVRACVYDWQMAEWSRCSA